MARDYDSSVGRYIQSDSIGLAGGLNIYTYALSNPVMFVDPSGLMCEFNEERCLGQALTNLQDCLSRTGPCCLLAGALF